ALHQLEKMGGINNKRHRCKPSKCIARLFYFQNSYKNQYNVHVNAEKEKNPSKLLVHREELELDRDRWRRRPGDRERSRERLHLLLMRGGVRRHMGGGGGILLGGLSLRGGGRMRGASTAVAVISCPSIWPVEDRRMSK
uniref:Uncharacterized protein n=1 Tax=Denticeps clupeoides TaxID=299321 RepID=A0AAY4BD43_9TELE